MEYAEIFANAKLAGCMRPYTLRNIRNDIREHYSANDPEAAAWVNEITEMLIDLDGDPPEMDVTE